MWHSRQHLRLINKRKTRAVVALVTWCVWWRHRGRNGRSGWSHGEVLAGREKLLFILNCVKCFQCVRSELGLRGNSFQVFKNMYLHSNVLKTVSTAIMLKYFHTHRCPDRDICMCLTLTWTSLKCNQLKKKKKARNVENMLKKFQRCLIYGYDVSAFVCGIFCFLDFSWDFFFFFVFALKHYT